MRGTGIPIQRVTPLRCRDPERGAKTVLRGKFDKVKEEEGYLRVYDVDDTEAIVEYLLQNGHVVSEIQKNKIGLEEYYVELMAKKGDA